MANNDNRDAQALDYDPSYDKSKYVKDYKEIKQKGKRDGHPDVQPHHIRGLNNYHYAWKHLNPKNRSLLQSELSQYGIGFGNDKDNLVAAEGQLSKSKPGETRYGGQHGLLHNRQETAMQDMGVDRFKGSYRGVGGVKWSDMSQEEIMGFLRSMAIKDEMTMNDTLSTALPIKSKGALKLNSRLEGFRNRLTSQTDAISTVFNMQGSSVEQAAEISRDTTSKREQMASIAREKGGAFGMPDLGITELLAGKSFVQDERQVFSKNGSMQFTNRLRRQP